MVPYTLDHAKSGAIFISPVLLESMTTEVGAHCYPSGFHVYNFTAKRLHNSPNRTKRNS